MYIEQHTLTKLNLMETKRQVYLDTNATTPLAKEVIETVKSTMVEAWGNPSSSYSPGVTAKAVIETARNNVAHMIGAEQRDIIFMSGGTEVNNTVLNTMLGHFHELFSRKHVRTFDGAGSPKQRPHFITTNLEHDSITCVLQRYSQIDLADVTVVEACVHSGRVAVKDIVDAVRPMTCLITVMLANNETGIIQPVGEICRKVKSLVRYPGETTRIFTHSDAAQAVGKIDVCVEDLQVDYLTVVGHKFYGPRIGALYARRAGDATPVLPLMFGGGQERGFRSGTENTAMIAGLGKAAELVSQNLSKYESHMSQHRDYLEQRLEKRFGASVCINMRHAGVERLPNTSSVSFTHQLALGHAVLSKCGVLQASVGAACHSQNKASHVLLASGVPSHLARNAIRLSVGRDTTFADIDDVIDDLDDVICQLHS